jgi:hypothetical protein
MSAFANFIKRVPNDYSGQYIVAVRGGRATHMWTLSNADGAVHIHGWMHESPSYGREWLGGIEIHSPKQLYGSEPADPTQKHCWLLDGPCWHDGSSLYFSEHLAPLLERYASDDVFPSHVHEWMLGALLSWHRDRFARPEAEDAA